MAELTLGVDLGPASIGWALIDEEGHKIIATGVRVFPEGVDRDTSGAEVSKNEQRRVARGMRRQTARRARRKRKLREALVEASLLPPLALQANDAPERVVWEHEQFKAADPYTLRTRALREKLDLRELGRALLHLNQRRGFRSNRKTDRANKKERSEMLDEINELQAAMEDRHLSEELARRRGDDPKQFHLHRIRGLHTNREMYKREFAAIWETQQKYHPELLTNELRERVHRIIFFQRDILPPSPGLIGRCELEPRLPRCPRADRRAQRFRLFQEVNNLRVLDTSTREERALTADERDKLIRYLLTGKQRTFEQIAKHLFEQHQSIHFNLEAGGRTKLLGMPIDAAIASKKVVGRGWYNLPEELRDRIVAAIIDDQPERLEHLLHEAALDSGLRDVLLDQVDFDQGHSSYSLHAIKKLLPHLQRGLPLSSRDASIPCALREAGYVMPWEHAVEAQVQLPEPPNVTNPLVRAALFEVRKVVNAILREYVYREKHTLAHVRIELAREARGTAEQRRKRSIEMRQRERQRNAAADAIRETGARATRDAINRYLLWDEQSRTCIYSGRPISVARLFGGEVDIDHILPRSRSLDDSMMNKVVCFRSENAAKGNRTPHEWLAASDPERLDEIIQRAKRLPAHCYPKLKRFYQKTVELDDFFARQFVDTTYITTQVHQYLQHLGADVLCIRGQHTAQLRWHWGLNTVLREDDLDLKNREDHRHHAVDALVIALTNRSRLQQLARIQRESGTESTGEILPEPWPESRRDVEQAVNGIVVSHRPRRRVSGPLHDENPYGPTETPHVFVKRKPLADLSPNEIDHIRDPGLKRLIVAHLDRCGLKHGRGVKVDKPWKEALQNVCMPSGIPIRNARLLVPEQSVVPIRGGRAWVKPGSVHHACIFEVKDAKGRPRRDAVYVTLIEAMGRIRRRVPVVQRVHPDDPEAKFIMSVCTGDMLLAREDGKERVVVVSTLVSTQKRIHIVDANDARPSSKKKDIGKRPNTLDARKITVDPLGRVRWAND